jgi:hypothetical protein
MTTLVSTAGSETANSYATLAEANLYMETVRPADETVWLQEAESTRERLLIMSSRLIDQHWQFIGLKKDTDQALQFPRSNVPKDGRWSNDGTLDYLADDTIPQFLKDATGELARVLIETDTTGDPDGAGFKQIAMAGMAVTFDSSDRISQGVFRTSVYSFLRKYGYYKPSLNSSSAGIAQTRVIR